MKLGAAGSALYTQGQQPLRQSSFKVAKVGHSETPLTLPQPQKHVEHITGTARLPDAQYMESAVWPRCECVTPNLPLL